MALWRARHERMAGCTDPRETFDDYLDHFESEYTTSFLKTLDGKAMCAHPRSPTTQRPPQQPGSATMPATPLNLRSTVLAPPTV
jgi:hypothetical protein